MGRLGRTKIKPKEPHTDLVEPSRIHVWQVDTMVEAAATVHRRQQFWGYTGEKKQANLDIEPRAVNGVESRWKAELEYSDRLIDDAIVYDPRLAKRHRWRRAEDGVFADAALVAMGDDTPCFDRKRETLSESPGCQDVVRLVISTDANEVTPHTAAAFIALCRLVQQFKTVEVWWQGAWLNAERTAGFVFHVPLVIGDMDYSRLDFCIADDRRDSLSYSVMLAKALEIRKRWKNCGTQARGSYLSSYTLFINHTGIKPDGKDIAQYAAYVLGWESMWHIEDDLQANQSAALQELPKDPPKQEPITPEQQRERDRYWAEYGARQKREEAERNRQRLDAAS